MFFCKDDAAGPTYCEDNKRKIAEIYRYAINPSVELIASYNLYLTLYYLADITNKTSLRIVIIEQYNQCINSMYRSNKIIIKQMGCVSLLNGDYAKERLISYDGDVFEVAEKLLSETPDFECVRRKVLDKYNSCLMDEAKHVILCGNSPFAPHAERVLREKYRCDVTVVDSPEKAAQGKPEYTYVITTTKFLGDYSALLIEKGASRIIPYHALPIIDTAYDFPRKSYSSRFFKTYVESILCNKDAYRTLMKKLCDDESKNIMARLISYCLTLDVRYAAVPHHSNYYFGHEFLHVSEDEVFIDGGGFDGDTLNDYLNAYKSFGAYYLFEPEEEVIERAKARFLGINYNIKFMNMALYNTKTTVSFKPDGNGMGQINEETGCGKIQTCRIDDLTDDPVSFIKLDVEGAELAVLQGARETLKRRNPKLLISVYHNAGDVLTLSRYVQEAVPQYKFFLRCGFNSVFNDLLLLAVL